MDTELIKDCAILMNLNGLNTKQRSFFAELNIWSSIFLTIGFAIECALEVLWEWKGILSLDSLAVVVASYQLLSKYAILILHRDKFNEILNCIDENYWPLNKCGHKSELKFKYICNLLRKIMIVTIIMSATTISMYTVSPLFDTNRKLPIPIFHPRNLSESPNYEIAYVLEAFILIKVMPSSVLAFDFLFIALTAHVVFQLRMINKKIAALIYNEDTNTMEQLKVIGNHHSMVLRCVQYMKEIYSIVLLNQFLTVMFLICMGLLFIIDSEFRVPIPELIRVAGYIIVFSVLLFFYCLAGTYLTFESAAVATAAFRSNWWIRTQPRLRRSVSLVIQRAQKHEILSAAGMMNLNLETFSNVIRSALSFFMVVQTLFNKKQVKF